MGPANGIGSIAQKKEQEKEVKDRKKNSQFPQTNQNLEAI